MPKIFFSYFHFIVLFKLQYLLIFNFHDKPRRFVYGPVAGEYVAGVDSAVLSI